MKDLFKEISEKENGQFKYSEDIVASGIGSKSPHDLYNLSFNYRGKKITITNEIGLSSVGNLSCQFTNNKRLSDFSIRTISHFFKFLINRKKSFIIKCKNTELKHFFSNNKPLKELESLTTNTQFELSIFTERNINHFIVFAEYNILFENRKETLITLINFYKELIDTFENRNY